MLYGHNVNPSSYSILSNISLEIGSKQFVSTEIIEKIVQDVEGWHIKKGGYTELAHQLRDKYL
jgi:hypothetical protein